MFNLSDDCIKEIADQMDMGFLCYCHKKTGELLFIPDQIRYPDFDEETWPEEIEKLKKDSGNYLEIEPLETTESYQIMADFADQLKGNENLRTQLINALSHKHPFRNFNTIIHNEDTYKEQWFDFKNTKLSDWVKNKLSVLT